MVRLAIKRVRPSGRVTAFIMGSLCVKRATRFKVCGVSCSRCGGWGGLNGPLFSVYFGGQYNFVLIDRNDIVLFAIETQGAGINPFVEPGLLLEIIIKVGHVTIDAAIRLVFCDDGFLAGVIELDDDLAGVIRL